ncbi:MAG: glycosyltransferase family 9 protein [Candidatus Acidiferrales bacterium]
MSDERFLIVRLGSLGDIVHTLPAAAALRDTFPSAQIDWVVEAKWRALLEGNADLNRVIILDRSRAGSFFSVRRALSESHYATAIDFQSLYKSAYLARGARAKETLGFDWSASREKLATLLYTRRVHPSGTHKVEHNLSLAEAAGAKRGEPRFPLPVSTDAEAWAERELRERNLTDFFVMSPGGGWRSKCWPAERYAQFHREIFSRLGWRGVVSFGPGEENLAKQVLESGAPGDRNRPLLLPMHLTQLMSVLRRAKFMVAGDTGPLHLAAALGTPVIGLYGPTDPARNGPYSERAAVVRKAHPGETSYKRRPSDSAAMLRIEVADVANAVNQLLERR